MADPRQYFDDLGAAFSLLTRLPMPRRQAAADPNRSFWAYPIVGLAVAGIAALVLAGAAWIGLPGLLTGLLAVLVMLALTGAFHEDGLADTADGFGGGLDRARKLEIMRDSRIGAYGVIALVLSIGLRAAAIAGLFAHSPGTAAGALIAAAALSRAMMVFLLFRLPPARAGGLGAGAGQASAGSLAAALAIAALTGFVTLGFGGGILALLSAAASAWLLLLLARRQIGGHTGDVLGAAQQVSEIAVLILLLAAASGP